MQERSPAQVFGLVVGVTLVATGILGFFYNASFGTGDGTERDAVLGILDVNAWHNLVHIASGVLGLLAFASGPAASRTYALVFGIVYLIVAIWGFIIGSHESILGFIPVNTEDNVLHLILGVLGVGAYAASDPAVERRRTTTTRAA
jgi:hypothetical protein